MIENPVYRKVLFCTDFSENSDLAFGYALGIAKRDGGTLYIMHVVPDNPSMAIVSGFVPKEMYTEIQEKVESNLNQNYRHYLDKIDKDIEFKVVTEYGREQEEIIKFAKKEDVDIIVIGTHGRTGKDHVFFGSVAEKVIRHSPLPVFVIPGKKNH